MIDISSSTSIGSLGNIKHDKKHRLKQRFEVKKKLGQGTYGKVQLAINKKTGQEVAIKTIKKSKIESEQDLVRIRREIQIMSSIQHPHIIHIFEVFENKEKIVLVMQYASGGELYEYVSERKVLNDNEARRLFRQIATAVYYCHKNKVCHRDLKLENILLDHNGNAKIGDFGLSNVFDEKHFLNTFCGSPLYASPEIVKGIPYYGAEVDCWSLGVLLYTLVYGAMPFDGSNFKRLVKQISEASYYEPKQKSEASGLIRRLLAVDPAKRATIIDICTDWWVNKGYEHSLLQVAEDLANLTPVRLDILLALAPISPTAQNDVHPLAHPEEAGKKKKIGKTKKDETQATDYQADTSELSTDIPTYPEEEEEELADASEIIDDGEEFLPSAVAVALEEECQTEDGVAGEQDDDLAGKSTKRVASTSFDQSLTRVPSHVMKKKKPKKGPELAISEIDDKQISSGYASEGTITTISASKDDSTVKPDKLILAGDDVPNSNKVPIDSFKDETLSTSSQVSSLPTQSKTEPSIEPSHTPSCASIETLTEKDSQTFTDNTIKNDASLQSEPPKSPSNVKEKSSKSSNQSMLHPENRTPTNEVQSHDEAKPSLDSSVPQAIPKEETSNSHKDTPTSPAGSEIGSTPATPEINDDKGKPWLERRASVNRKVGKISYPKFLEGNTTAEKKPVPAYGKISDAKRMFESRRSSIDKDKERVIPMVKVSDAKRAFERRASMPAPAPLWKNAGERKASLSTQASLDSSTNRALTAKEKVEKKQPAVTGPKKSPSPDKRRSPIKSPMRKEPEKPVVSNDSNESPETQPESKQPSDARQSPAKEEEVKLKAKDVIKKQIAKAKLQELRQSSVESYESNTSDQVKSCPIPDSKPKSYVKAPQPFVKDETKPKPIRSVAEIKLTPKPKLGLDIEAASQSTRNQIREETTPPTTYITETPSVSLKEQDSNPCTPSLQPTKAAPITRSYKKVTFTKDGACITETGKIVSEEGADGSFSRIEKKSKVTHYPTGQPSTRSESSEETRTVRSFGGSIDDGLKSGSVSPTIISHTIPGLRRSESASSSGSTDIFDDIFDTWSGDPIFSNLSGRMRSMLHGGPGARSPFSTLWGSNRKRSKKKSRAESCERKPSTEGITSFQRTGHGTDQECSDTDTDTEPSMGVSSGGLWKFLGTTPSSTNILDRHRSLLSKHFGSDDLFADTETAFGSPFRRSLSRDRGVTGSFASSRNSQTPTVRMVINPLLSRGSGSRITPSKQDSLESNESGGGVGGTESFVNIPMGGSFSSKREPMPRAFSRNISRESRRGEDPASFESDEGPSSRRRVEQWLDTSGDDELDRNHPISMYTTLRPRTINRYGRSLSSKYDLEDKKGELRGGSGVEHGSGSNLSFNTTQEIQIGNPDERRIGGGGINVAGKHVSSTPRSEVIIPVGRSGSRTNPVIQMKLSLGGEPSEIRTFTTTTADSANTTPLSTPEAGSDWSSPVLLPESSSLLEQLRTHGYRNLVSQRLSGVTGSVSGSSIGGIGGTEERYENRETSSSLPPPSQQMKRGKSLMGDSSSNRDLIENGAWFPVNGEKSNTECMRLMTETNHDTKFNRDNSDSPVVHQEEVQCSGTVDGGCSKEDNCHPSSSVTSSLPPKPRSIDLTATGANNHNQNHSSQQHQKNDHHQSPSHKLTVQHDHDDVVDDNYNDSTHRSLTNAYNIDSNHKETLQERILRKSYYSRFNHPLERRSSSTRRRSSFIEGDHRFMDFTLNDNSSRFLTNHNTTTANNSHHLSKPPLFLTNDQFIERVQVRAQQLIEEARERHTRLNNQLWSTYRPTHGHLNGHSSHQPPRDYYRDPSPLLLRTSSFSGSDDFTSSSKRRGSTASTTATATNRTTSTKLSNGHSQDLGDDDDDNDDNKDDHLTKDDLSSHVQVVTEALQLLKERALQDH